MKLVHVFWLTAVAMAFLAVDSIVPLPRALAQMVELAFAAAALYGSLSKAMSIKHRAVLLIAGLALALPPILTWLQIATGTSLTSSETWTDLLTLRLVIVGVSLNVFGFDLTTKPAYRLIITVVVFVWGIFNVGGVPALLDKVQIAFLLTALAIGGVSYWLSRYLGQTADANGPKT